MKTLFHILFFCSAFVAAPIYAGMGSGPSMDDTATTETKPPFSFEAEAELAYVGDSDVSRGSRHVNDFDETYSLLRFVYTPRIKIGILRLGASWERFNFGMPDNVQTPDTLQAVTAIVGFDTQFSDSILFRIEAQPGLYGTEDNLEGDTFNVPFVIGGTYIYSSDLQFVLGVAVDFERKYPVLPGGGIRWRLASQCLLNAVLPTPRLEFEATRNVTIYAGANVKSSTFRTENNFGDEQADDDRLNDAVITYTEVRAGLGIECKLSPEIKVAAEAGYLPYREFDFHRADVRYHHDSGAPYGSVAFRAAF